MYNFPQGFSFYTLVIYIQSLFFFLNILSMSLKDNIFEEYN